MARELIAIHQTMDPLIVPGLSTSSSTTPTPASASSSSQDSVGDSSKYTEIQCPKEVEVRVRSLLHKPTETENKNTNEGCEEVQSDLLHDLSDWLQEFREILVDESSPFRATGKPCAWTSRHSQFFSWITNGVASKSGTGYRVSTVSTRTFRRTQIAISARRQKMKRASCKKNVLVQSCPGRKILVTWYLQIKQNSVKEVNRGTIIDMPWWYKIWQLSGYNPTRAKQKLLRRPRRAKWSSWSRRGSQKSFTRAIPWHSASLVKNYPGITVRQHHTDQKQIGIAKRAVRRVTEGISAVLLRSGLDENRWTDSIECKTYLRNVTDLLSDGKTPYERRFGMQL